MVERYEKLFDRAMKLYQEHSEKYNTLVREYEDLLLEKRILHITPLNKIKGSALKEWPEIPFLAVDESEAEEFLLGLTEGELVEVVVAIDLFQDSYIYRALQARILDYKYEIRNHNRPRTPFGVDPDRCCGNGVRYSSSRGHATRDDS